MCVCEYKHSYCTAFYMFTFEDVMNVLQVEVHKLWKFHSECLLHVYFRRRHECTASGSAQTVEVSQRAT